VIFNKYAAGLKMKKSAIILVIPITILAFFTLLPASLTAKPISIQAGVCVYPDPELGEKVFVEFPFVVNRNQFTFLPNDSLGDFLLGAVFAEIMLTDLEDRPVDSASIYFLTRAADSVDAANKESRLFNQLSMEIKPGVYKGRLTVLDVVNKNEGSFIYDRLEIEPVVTDHLNLSSIQFAHKISNAGPGENAERSGRVKSGRVIIPNPMGLYKEGDSNLYVYSELYNLAYDSSAPDSFLISYTILDEQSMIYHQYEDLPMAKQGTSSAISDALNISAFAPGRYTLQLTATDMGSGEADTAGGSFIVFSRQGETPGLVSYQHRFPYDSCGLETKQRLVKYFLAPQEMTMLKGLNDVGKMRFIDQYFSDKDPDPATEINEFLNELFIRYIYANKNFSSLPGQGDGWSRDRGRILMQYGNWDQRDEVLTPAYGKPYEIWKYYKLQGGGVIFVFQDVEGYGDFKLVHSTATGEVFDSEWDYIVRGSDPNLNR